MRLSRTRGLPRVSSRSCDPPGRLYYRVADLTLCDAIGHDYSVPSVFHDEGERLYECSRCGEINA